MSETFVISILALMNVAQLIFWSINNQKLVNKLMSRNFAEYELIKSGPPESQKPQIDFNDYEEEMEEAEILKELNGLLPTRNN